MIKFELGRAAYPIHVHDNERCLPFLDLNVHITDRGNLELVFAVKPHTPTNITFDSHHPFCHEVPRSRF